VRDRTHGGRPIPRGKQQPPRYDWTRPGGAGGNLCLRRTCVEGKPALSVTKRILGSFPRTPAGVRLIMGGRSAGSAGYRPPWRCWLPRRPTSALTLQPSRICKAGGLNPRLTSHRPCGVGAINAFKNRRFFERSSFQGFLQIPAQSRKNCPSGVRSTDPARSPCTLGAVQRREQALCVPWRAQQVGRLQQPAQFISRDQRHIRRAPARRLRGHIPQ